MSHSRPAASQDVAALAVAATSLLALIFPVVAVGNFPAGHDSSAHLTYTHLFDRALREGQFPVRWIEWVRAGHGQPLFNFYQPGLFYIVQAIHLAIPSLTLSLKLTILLLWWTATGFAYLTFRRLGRLPAAAGALAFAFAPYLLLDLFVRCAYPEVAGITFGAGVLWALDRWLTTVRPIWLPTLAVLAALLVVSHPPTALILSPLFLVYAVYLLLMRRTSMHAAAALLPAAFLAAGLAAFYLIPAIAELHLIRSATLMSGGLDFHRHFVMAKQWLPLGWGFGMSVEGPGDGMSFQIGLAQWLALGIATAVSVVKLLRRTATHRTLELVFWLAVGIGAMFSMTSASVRAWELFPPLAFVQFPWRLLMVVALATAALSAHLVSTITDRRLQAVFVIGLAIVQVQLSHAHLRPRGYITREAMDVDWLEWRDSKTAQKSAFLEQGYYPASLTHVPRDIARWTVMEGTANVTVVSHRGHQLDLAIVAEDEVVLRINSPAFPGWLVTIDGRPADSDLAGGYPCVTVPPGRHRVRAAFTNTPVRTWSNAVTIASGLALLMTLGWCAAEARRHRRGGQHGGTSLPRASESQTEPGLDISAGSVSAQR
jgi:hypothetical protein